MAFNKDSTVGTLTIVTGLCLVCSIVVSVAAVGLRPAQLENKALDKQSNILSVAGVDVSSVAKRDLAQLYGDKIEARLVDLATGEFVDGDADNFDTKLAAKDPAKSIRLASADDKAGLRQISRLIPVFFAKDAEGKVDNIILPIYGQGLWSTMYAFVAVAADGETIKGIGQSARADISEFLGRTVHLFLQVKVRENWQDEPERYSEMGLDFKDGES